MVIVITVSAVLIGFLTKYKGDAYDGGIRLYQAPLRVGLVFAWISLFPCVAPIIYLITSWFIGINQVASSRLYHYMFWICCAIALICFIVGFICLMFPASAVLQYSFAAPVAPTPAE